MNTRLFLFATIVFAQAATASAEDFQPLQIEWNTLAPAEGNQFRDPFAKLSRDQLQHLSHFLRIQRLIDAEKLSADGDAAAKAAEMAGRLKKEGVDIPWLMAQRERVTLLREKHAEALTKSIAKKLDGKRVRLTGYVMPLKVTDGRVTEFFLVSSLSMCSHEAAPPANQLVHVVSREGIAGWSRLTTVRVTGRLEAKQTARTIQRADGPKRIAGAYAIAPDAIEVLAVRKRLAGAQ